MDFQCTQVIEDDENSTSSGYSSPDDKAQVGNLEIGNTKYPVLRGLTKIGRHPACEICLEDSTVSKIHAEIEANGKNVFISDLQSSNKTRLNDAVLLPSRFYELQDGATLKFGVVECRFLLKRPENESVLAPETPEPGLRLRPDDSQEISIIEATPRPQGDESFRRPAVPIQKRRIPIMKPLIPGSEEELQNLETQMNTGDDLEDLETQCSTLKNVSTNDEIQGMNSQAGKSALEVPEDSDNLVSIQNMETQVTSNIVKLQTSENLSGSSKNVSDLEELDTQVFPSGDDAKGVGGAPGGSKECSSETSPGGKIGIHDLETQKFSPDHAEDLADVPGGSGSIGAPGKGENRYTYVIGARGTKAIDEEDIQTSHSEDDKEGAGATLRESKKTSGANDLRKTSADDDSNHHSDAKINSESKVAFQENKSSNPGSSRGLPENASIEDLETQAAEGLLHDLQTQPVDADDLQGLEVRGTSDPGKKKGKRLSQYEEDLKKLKSDIFGGERGHRSHDDDDDDDDDDNDDDLSEIYDLPTQTNVEYADALREQNQKAGVSRAPSSSPDLMKLPGNIIIDDSDDCMHNDSSLIGKRRRVEATNVGGEGSGLGNDDRNHRAMGSNDDDKSREKNGNRGRFKKNGIVSDSDSDDNRDNDVGESSGQVTVKKLGKSFSEDIGRSENNRESSTDHRKSLRSGDKAGNDSDGETDFEDELMRSSKNNFQNAKSSKDDGMVKSSASAKKIRVDSSECDTDFEELEDKRDGKLNGQSSKNDFESSKSSGNDSTLSKEGFSRKHVIIEDSDDTTAYENANITSKSSKNGSKNCKSSKNNFKSSKSAAVASDDDTDYEDLSTLKGSKNNFKSSKSLKNNRKLSKSLPAASEDDIDFDDHKVIPKITSKSSKADLKDSKSSKSTTEHQKVISAASGTDTDFEGDPVASKSSKNHTSLKSSKSAATKLPKASYIISDSEEDEETPEKSLRTSSVITVGSSSSRSSRLPQTLSKTISISSESSESEVDRKESSRTSRISAKSSKCPPENHPKSSKIINGHSAAITVIPAKHHRVTESSGSDTDYGPLSKPSKSSKTDSENSKSVRKSSDTSTSVQNDGGLDTSDLPPDVLKMFQSSKNSENGDCDYEDDPYSAPTQLIIQPKPSKVPQKVSTNNLKSSSGPGNRHQNHQQEDSDEDSMPTQKIDIQNHQKNRDLDVDDMEPTQVIPPSSRHQEDHHQADEDEDLMPTQKIDMDSLKSRPIIDFDDTEPTQLISVPPDHRAQNDDGDLEPTQKINLPGPSSRTEPVVMDFDDDLAPTQIIDPKKIPTPYFNDDSSTKKRRLHEDDADNSKRMRFLDDSDTCQVIDVEGMKRQNDLRKKQENLGRTGNVTPTISKIAPKKISAVPSSDSEELENVSKKNSSSKVTKSMRTTRNHQKSLKMPQNSSKITSRKFAVIPSSDSEELEDNSEDDSRISKIPKSRKNPRNSPTTSQNSPKSRKPPRNLKKITDIPASGDLDKPLDKSHATKSSRAPRNLPETSKNPQRSTRHLPSPRNSKTTGKKIAEIPSSDSEDRDTIEMNSDSPRSSKAPRNPPEISKNSKKTTQKIQNTSRPSKKIPEKRDLTPREEVDDPAVILKNSPVSSRLPTPQRTPPNPDVPKMTTSTPFGATPATKRRFNLSLRSRRGAESKDSAFSDSRSITNDKSSQNNLQSHPKPNESLDDSISRDLDSMFGGGEDRGIDPGGFAMTQEVVDVLKSSQPPPASPRVQEPDESPKKITRTRSKTGKNQPKVKQIEEKSAVAVPADDVDSQDNHLRTWKGRKRAKNVMESMSSEEESISGFDKGIAVETNDSGASTPRKSSRLLGKGNAKASEGSEADLQKKMTPRSSSRRETGKNSEAGPSTSIWGISEVNSTSQTSEKGLVKTGTSRVERIPKISLRKIAEIKDESSEDEDDFQKINKMADKFLTSPGAGRSPGRGRKGLGVARISKIPEKMEKKEVKKEPKREDDERSLRERPGGRKNEGRTAGKTLEKVQTDEVEEVLEKNAEKSKISEEKAKRVEEKGKKLEDELKTCSSSTSSRGRGRKKAEEIPQGVNVGKEEKKRGRRRKNEEDEGTRSKRMRVDESQESTPELPPQEVRMLLRGSEDAHERTQERLEETVREKKGKVEERKRKMEDVSSPSRAVRSRSLLEEHKPQLVLFTGIQEYVDRDSVEGLGGTVTDDPHKATILVTDKVRRTFKFFCAISRGIPIVSITWLQSSIASKKFLDPSRYILQDPASEAKFKFNLERSLARAREKKLLEGRTIVLTSKLSGPSIADLKTMIQTAGGKSLVRAPTVWPNDSVIVSCPEDLPKVKKMISKVKNVKVHVVDIEFLLSGLLRQELNYDEFALKV